MKVLSREASADRRWTLAAVALILGLAVGCGHVPSTADDRRTCRRDLRASFGLVARNYGGYAEKLARLGQNTIQRAQHEALRAVDAHDARPCEEILNSWLSIFGEGHLGVGVAPDAAARERAARVPEFEILSDDAALIRAPSFAAAHRDALEELVAANGAEILRRRDLIIDVRGNGGGNSSTFEVLAELAYVEPVRITGADVLATQENIEAWSWMLPHLRSDDREYAKGVIAQMRARRGEWVNFLPDALLRREAALPLPSRIAVLIDGGCGSACERFVLEVRQSPKVRLFGSTTRGNLDHASLRPHPLPSGRLLWLGTTRPHRAENSIDGIGIAPHVELDPALFDGPTRRAALARVLRDLELTPDVM